MLTLNVSIFTYHHCHATPQAASWHIFSAIIIGVFTSHHAQVLSLAAQAGHHYAISLVIIAITGRGSLAVGRLQSSLHYFLLPSSRHHQYAIAGIITSHINTPLLYRHIALINIRRITVSFFTTAGRYVIVQTHASRRRFRHCRALLRHFGFIVTSRCGHHRYFPVSRHCLIRAVTNTSRQAATRHTPGYEAPHYHAVNTPISLVTTPITTASSHAAASRLLRQAIAGHCYKYRHTILNTLATIVIMPSRQIIIFHANTRH